MKFPAPDDWDEQADGYCILLACIPNSDKWRALYRGQFYQPTWWKYYDKDGPPFNPVIQIAKEIYEGLCMANCDDIVNALNNISAAITAMGDLSQLTTIAANINTTNTTLAGIGNLSELANVAANVETLRATLEARSIAETTAQNTNFTDLITTFNNYTPVQCGCGGGCSSCGYTGGNQPASEPATEGQDPPINIGGQIVWTPPEGAPTGGQPGSTAYYDRKCKASNAIHQDLVNYISALNANSVTQLSFDLAFAMAGYLLGEIASPVPILDGVIGAIIGLLLDVVLAILGEGVDLSELEQALIDNEQALVCALYNSTNDLDALADYNGVLDTAGVSLGNQALISAIYSYDVLNYLYFKGEGYFEAKLAVYTPPLACGDCDCQISSQLGQITSWDGTTLQAQAQWGNVGNNPDDYWVHIDTSQGCGHLRITSISLTNYTLPTVQGLGSCSWVDDQGVTHLGNQNDPETFMLNEIVGAGQWFNIVSDTQFTVTMTFQEVTP